MDELDSDKFGSDFKNKGKFEKSSENLDSIDTNRPLGQFQSIMKFELKNENQEDLI